MGGGDRPPKGAVAKDAQNSATSQPQAIQATILGGSRQGRRLLEQQQREHPHFWTELGRIPAFNYIQLSICPRRRHQIRNSKPEGCPGRNVSSASQSDPEGGRNLVMDLQQSGIGSGAKTPGICPPPNAPPHVHSGQSTAGQIGAGGGHRTQPIQGHEASQLGQSPSASRSQQLWKQLCSKLR